MMKRKLGWGFVAVLAGLPALTVATARAAKEEKICKAERAALEEGAAKQKELQELSKRKQNPTAMAPEIMRMASKMRKLREVLARCEKATETSSAPGPKCKKELLAHSKAVEKRRSLDAELGKIFRGNLLLLNQLKDAKTEEKRKGFERQLKDKIGAAGWALYKESLGADERITHLKKEHDACLKKAN